MSLDPITRRTLMRRSAATGLSFAFAQYLAACGGVDAENKQSSSTTSTQAAAANHPKTQFATVAFANWPLYIDKKVLKDFNKEFNTKIKYTEEINDNEEYFAKVRQELESGKPIGRDLVALTDWMCARWIQAGYVEPIDKDNVPNAKNLVPALQSVPFDPDRSYTLPWQSGMTAIGYDPERTGRELSSVNDLFDPKFKGRVSFLQEWRDTASFIMLGDGKTPDKATKDDYLAAIDKIEKANADGQIRRFTGNDYTTDLTKGNTWLAVAYSGDMVQLQSDNPDLRFAYPEEGAMLFTDNMMMPAKAKHIYAAETMMNYVYEPEVAATLAIYVNYLSPVKGVKEIVEKTEPEIANNPLIFPPDDVELTAYPALSPEEESQMQEAMAQVTGG